MPLMVLWNYVVISISLGWTSTLQTEDGIVRVSVGVSKLQLDTISGDKHRWKVQAVHTKG